MLLRFQFWVFTVAITVISRICIAGGRLLRLERIRVKEFGSLGVPTTFPSGSNLIDANLVHPAGETKAAVLICHGIGETVSTWKSVQRLLAQHGVASLVFNYSGWGQSTGFVDVRQCEADALAAFRLLSDRMPGQRISLLGFSLGTGVASAIAPQVKPHRLILCASYTSLRRAARSMGFPWPLPLLLPPVWDNAAAMERCTIPTVIVHGERDGLFSSRMATTLAEACAAPCDLILMADYSHARPIFAPDMAYWGQIVDRL